MSTELERFRDHARTMANSTPGTRVRASWNGGWREQTVKVGDMPDAERALWARLADEVDAHLDQPHALFEAGIDFYPPAICTTSPDCDADDHTLACPSNDRRPPPEGDRP